MQISTKFSLKDTVQIPEINKPGRVLAIYICETGVQYSIRYFIDGTAHTSYFFEDEIVENQKKEKVGFKTENV